MHHAHCTNKPELREIIAAPLKQTQQSGLALQREHPETDKHR